VLHTRKYFASRLFFFSFFKPKIQQENLKGPKLFDKEAGEDEEDEEEEKKKKKSQKRRQFKRKGEEDEEVEGSSFNKEKLREYELTKLKYNTNSLSSKTKNSFFSLSGFTFFFCRYYFAVAVFDTLETASNVYDQCDGLELERTSNILDLRFVPDEIDLSQRQVR
jgi:hypothetical protein